MDSLKYESLTANAYVGHTPRTVKHSLSTSFTDQHSMSRVSAEEMDEMRQQNIAYEYLCHLEEAKKYPIQPFTLFHLNFLSQVHFFF
jgi:hypothetical protein